jgi:hypothetical protein
MDTMQQVDLAQIKRLRRIQKALTDWACEGPQIAGDDAKEVIDRLTKNGYAVRDDAPRSFILAEGATGAIGLEDGSEAYLYWE